MCGITAYINHRIPRTQEEIGKILINGLKRMEYRGYDSAGLCVRNNDGFTIIKKTGKVEELARAINILTQDTMESSVSIAHTRWATHGFPCEKNSHPISSDINNEFVVVHNGIITNYKELNEFLKKRNYSFHTDTDTETAAKLALYFYERNKNASFMSIIKNVVRCCDGAFAFIFVSSHFPNEMIAVRKSSPLLIGVKSNSNLSMDSFNVHFDESSVDNVQSIDNVEERVEKIYKFTEENSKSDDMSLSGHSISSDATSRDAAILPISPSYSNTGVLNAEEGSNFTECQTEDLRTSPTSLKIKVKDNEQIEYFLASDTSAIIEHTKKVIYLEDCDIVRIKDGKLEIHRFSDIKTESKRFINTLEMELENIMKGKFPHFMLKEIYEQSESVVNTMRGRLQLSCTTGESEKDVAEKICQEAGKDNWYKIKLGGLDSYIENIKRSSRLIFIACGTSYHTAMATQSLFEELIDIPVSIEIASNFLDRQCPIFRSDCVFFISQSGETADTLNALMYCKSKQALCVGITNTVGSTICRETECGVHVNCGPEIGVASTKAYSSQFIVLVMIALVLSSDNLKHEKRRKEIVDGLRDISGLIKKTLEIDEYIKVLAQKICDRGDMLILGRGYQHALCLEAALKIKEVAYMHAEGILTGELKHGPIALIEPETLVIMIITNDHVLKKSENAVSELMARRGKPIIVTNNELVDQFKKMGCMTIGIPTTVDCLQGLLTVIPMQLLSYHLAVIKGYDVDCPRNLAKSVTVE
ncbi:Glucosamine 6-phosphate synthetase [Trachipleistophora hominis]|uniref:glutamine--fructose-6-phosphate transaminase (isomerizing) n=1 Tax=Trachipleistophora hominis TaxID=72359 RepID=L7K0C0_TRAHO|nr:Glucosamine 6-phosphate synthetase [Trachipleistophora hominis]